MDDTEQFSLSLSEEGRYRLLVEAIVDYAIYMLDSTGIVTSWNPGAQRFKGYPAKEIIGQHFSRFYVDEDRQAGLPARALATAAREGKFEGEGWRVRNDGSRFWAHVVIDPIRDPAGRIVGYAKVTHDLTERRMAEETLRRSQEQFRLLVQSVTDYAIYMLDTQGAVSSWNEGAQRIKGYLKEEILGKHFSVFYRPEDRRRDLPTLALATAAREGKFESEGWRVKKDGSHFWAHVVIDPVRNDEGAIIGYAKITRDVTEKREAQLALEAARESLFQSQKLETIGQLTGGVAHDFNNLLMVILSSLELIRKRVGGDPKLLALVESAVQGAKRGASLTQRMLAFARKQELKPVAVDVCQLVHNMAGLLRQSLGTSIALDIRLPADLKPALVDPHQLEVALLNLVVNARDAMPGGGTITLTAFQEASAPASSRLAPGAYVCLQVIDTGEGMDEATLARAVEPFFTTKGVGKGTGLGLSTVEGLASQSGGQFVLRSRKGEGTTAELWLPVVRLGHDAATSEDLEDPARTSDARLVVLAVDDDALVLQSTVAMLEELGHTVHSADSAREALQVMRTEPGVQLLVTDYAMPDMTGMQLIEAALTERPGLATVLATGYAELKTELPPYVVRLGKPYGQSTLGLAVAAATSERRQAT